MQRQVHRLIAAVAAAVDQSGVVAQARFMGQGDVMNAGPAAAGPGVLTDPQAGEVRQAVMQLPPFQIAGIKDIQRQPPPGFVDADQAGFAARLRGAARLRRGFGEARAAGDADDCFAGPDAGDSGGAGGGSGWPFAAVPASKGVAQPLRMNTSAVSSLTSWGPG
ncbi:MAG: hypothetical protein P1U65_07610 [Minwuia sp.]|nr:hypothetical protein [Minwuia sp.]